MLGAGRVLAAASGAPLYAALLGSEAAPLAGKLGAADKVFVVEDPQLNLAPAGTVAAALKALVDQTQSGLVLLGLLGGVAFVLREAKLLYPVMNIALFKTNRVFLLSNLAALVNYSATFSVAFLLSLYLQYIQGLSPDKAGLVLLVQPIMMTVGSPFAGKLSDRIESRIIASLGMGLTCIGMGLLAFLHWDTSIGFILAGLAILGAGLALFSSPNTNAVMSSVDRKVYGVASAILGTMRLVGQVFSMGLAMSVFALYIGKNPIAPEYYGAFLAGVKVIFAISAALCFLGIFASLARGNVR